MSFLTNMENALLMFYNDYFDNVPMIPDYDNGPEPIGDYGVVGITVLNQLNKGSRSTSSKGTGALEESLKQDFRALVTITFYGDSCYDNAFEAQSIIKMSEALDKLYNENYLSIVDSTDVRRIPELRDTKYIQRATFDLTILTAYENLSDIDWFNIVGYQANYPDAGIQYNEYVPNQPT